MPFGVRFHYDHSFFPNSVKLDMIELTQIGEICLESSFEVESHQQCCHEISYIISGNGFFELDSKRIPVATGDVIITPDEGRHNIYSSDDEALSFAYMGFKFTDKSKLLLEHTGDFFKCSRQILIKDNEDIYIHFKKCMDEFYLCSEPNLLLVETYLIQIILLTHRMAVTSFKASRPEQQNPGQLVYRIIKYIDHNISKPLTVSGIADSLGYSSYYISHTFKAKMHKTLQNYIGECKTNRAKELIREGRLSMADIAEKLGYLNIQSFSRAFKRETNLSPSEFKIK